MNKSEMAFVPCGIEVSSQTLVVDRAGEAPREFPNTAAGHRSLLTWLHRSPIPPRVCLEPTGLYGLDLALHLTAAGLPLLVANPRAVRNFARAMRQRSKTDRLDAVVLREYAAHMSWAPWQPPSPQALKLMAVAQRLEALSFAAPEPASAPTGTKNRVATQTLSGWPPLDEAVSIAGSRAGRGLIVASHNGGLLEGSPV